MHATMRPLRAALLGAALLAQTLPASSAPTQQKQQPAAPAGAELREGKKALHAARAAEALVHLNRALALYGQANDKSGMAATQDLLGELYERQGQYDTALAYFNNALALFKSRADETKKAKEVASSAASKVAPGASDAAKVVANADAFNFNLTLSKIGNMHLRQGRVEEARAAFARMGAEKPDTSSLKNTVSKAGVAGSVLGGLMGEKKTINIPLGSVSSLFVAKHQYELYHQTVLYATQEIGLGRMDYLAEQFDSARKHFESAVEATKGDIPFLGNLGQTRRFRAAARTALGDLAFQQGRYDDAVDSYRKASKGAKDDKRLDLMWPAQLGEGRALWAQADAEKSPKKADERRAQALEAFRAAVETVEEIREGSVRADESRTTFLATTRDVFDAAAAASAEMALMKSTPGAPLAGEALRYADQGLRFAEQGRARSLLDLLSEAGGSITSDLPPDLLRQKRENLDRQNEIAAQLSGLAPDGAVPDKSVDKLEDELDELQKKYDELENRLREQSPRYKALTAAEPLALADVQRTVLDDSTALLEYSLGEKSSYLWAVTKNAAAIYRLPPRDEINRQAAALRDLLVPAQLRLALVSSGAGTDVQRAASPNASSALPPAAAFAAAAHALYTTIFAPVSAFVGQHRLLVAAEGALAYVPFEALVTAASAGGDYASLPFLINTNEVVYTPSASVIDALRRQAQGAAANASPGAILLVADPVFDPADPRAAGRPASAPNPTAEAARGLTLKKALKDVSPGPVPSSGALTVARLWATREEATQAAAAARAAGVRADPWLDLDASEEKASASDLRQYRIIHFATHGLLDADHPQFTGLVLSLVGNREADGFLRTDEVFNLKLGRPLVMLSACETGLGKEKRGEGVIGLTRAFMYAGAPTVGVTLWSVADNSTAALMSDFYRRLLGREQPAAAAALRDARREMIAGKRYAAPFYWAPFVLVGDWR